uniref:zinc finger protein 431-like n=1 Tax=Myodes glareolus TaxID=447135 RepID=UPI002021484B|nr:zinc finger protein 431-like [Myodes glareolus]
MGDVPFKGYRNDSIEPLIQFPCKNAVTYDDIHINFTLEKWNLLDPSQKNLYKDVMLETYKNLTTIGYNWEDHNIEEHCQSSRRYDR